MNPIDDDQLRASLHRTAESFDPSGGAATILASAVDSAHERASGSNSDGSSRQPRSRRTRFAYAAAIVIVAVVALTSAGLVLKTDSKKAGPSATAALGAHGVSGITTPSLPSQNQGYLGVQFSTTDQNGKLAERTQSTNKASKNTTLASKVVSTGTKVTCAVAEMVCARGSMVASIPPGEGSERSIRMIAGSVSRATSWATRPSSASPTIAGPPLKGTSHRCRAPLLVLVSRRPMTKGCAAFQRSSVTMANIFC